MTNKRFNEIVEDLTTHIKKTLTKKASEYNLTDDRLSSFKCAAEMQHNMPSQALLGMMTKHIVSIYDYVCTAEKFTEPMAREKIGDALDYLILLYAMLEEEGFKETIK